MKPIEAVPLFTLQDHPEEVQYDFQPKNFDEYIGQIELKQKLSIYTQAALMRQEPLDHVLLFGPPGLGKTTLATIMAQILNVGIKICSGPTLERTGDLVSILSSLEPRDILFIDEIHRMSISVEEMLYSAMEHFKIDIIIGQGAGAKSVNFPLAPFTLIGATTKAGMLSAPLRSRFGITERLDFYTPEELQQIVTQAARYLQLTIEPEAALVIAKVSRGTPRVAKKLVRRIRDFAQVKATTHITRDVISHCLSFLKIDLEGLTYMDQLLLRTIIERFDGGPVGLDTIASLLAEDAETIEDVYEPYLLRCGYLEKTSRGRQIPLKALPYLKDKLSI